MIIFVRNIDNVKDDLRISCEHSVEGKCCLPARILACNQCPLVSCAEDERVLLLLEKDGLIYKIAAKRDGFRVYTVQRRFEGSFDIEQPSIY